MISLSPEEQQLVRSVSAIMEHSGFSYVPVAVESNYFPSKSSNWQQRQQGSNNNAASKPPMHGKGSGKEKDYGSLFLSDQRIVMKLDPEIELLVTYVDVVSQYAEQEKEQEMIRRGEKPNRYYGRYQNHQNRVKYLKNHMTLSEEVKTVIYHEQRKYAIQCRVSA
jgi:hypothetical protein